MARLERKQPRRWPGLLWGLCWPLQRLAAAAGSSEAGEGEQARGTGGGDGVGADHPVAKTERRGVRGGTAAEADVVGVEASAAASPGDARGGGSGLVDTDGEGAGGVGFCQLMRLGGISA